MLPSIAAACDGHPLCTHRGASSPRSPAEGGDSSSGTRSRITAASRPSPPPCHRCCLAAFQGLKCSSSHLEFTAHGAQSPQFPPRDKPSLSPARTASRLPGDSQIVALKSQANSLLPAAKEQRARRSSAPTLPSFPSVPAGIELVLEGRVEEIWLPATGGMAPGTPGTQRCPPWRIAGRKAA